MQVISKAYAACSSVTAAPQPICGTKNLADVHSGNPSARRPARDDKHVKSKRLNPSDPAALCNLGPDEIARSRRTGGLLKAK